MVRTLQIRFLPTFKTYSYNGLNLISGGSDCTVKYWDFAMPSCPVQSINHFNDSIWKIVSKDADLKTFWVGTKNGTP